MNFPRGVKTALGLILVLAMTACSRRPIQTAPNILLITVDTLRLERISCYGGPPGNTPHIDALARAGVRFQSVQSPRGLTWPALTTLLTGLQPRSHHVRLNGDMLAENIRTLPEMLKDKGYATIGFLSNMCDAPHRGFDRFYCAWTDHFGQPVGRMPLKWASHKQPGWDAAITRKALEFLETPPHQPFFAWLHYIDPHKPYDPVAKFLRPDGDPSFDPQDEILDALTLGRTPLTAGQKQRLMAVYDSQISGVDAHIGEVLRRLEKQKLAGNTLVIFSVDHGEELGDHQLYFYHLASVYQQVLAVPWIMRWPGHLQQGLDIPEPVASVDITPTLLDLLKIHVSDPFDGESRAALALNRPGAQGASHTFAEWKDRMIIVGEGDWRYIWNPEHKAPKGMPFLLRHGTGFHIDTEELYDLSSDPRQQSNIIGEHTDRAGAMHAIACDFLKEKSFALRPHSVKPEVESRLRSLGYIQERAPSTGPELASHCDGRP